MNHLRIFLRAGHAPTLVAAFLYFAFSCCIWVLNGAMAPFISETFQLTPAQKGLMLSIPIFAGALMRLTQVERHTPGAQTVLGWNVDNILETVVGLRANSVDFRVYEGMGQDDNGIWRVPRPRPLAALPRPPAPRPQEDIFESVRHIADAALAAGVDALLEKPLDMPELLAAIEASLHEDKEARLARRAGQRAEFRYSPAHV